MEQTTCLDSNPGVENEPTMNFQVDATKEELERRDGFDCCLPEETDLRRRIVQQRFEYWPLTSTPGQGMTTPKTPPGRFISAAQAARASRRALVFDSSIDEIGGIGHDNKTDHSMFDELISENNDLRRDKEDLKAENRKVADDLRDAVGRLNEAEDRNTSLELEVNEIRKQSTGKIDKLKKQNRQLQLQLESKTEVLSETTEQLQEKSARLNRLEKEFHEVDGDRTTIRNELDKLYCVFNSSQKKNELLLSQIKEMQEAYDVQLQDCLQLKIKMEYDNQLLAIHVNDIKLANETLVAEKYELMESTKLSRKLNENMENLDETDFEETEDIEIAFEAAFPPIPPAIISIQAEISQAELQLSHCQHLDESLAIPVPNIVPIDDIFDLQNTWLYDEIQNELELTNENKTYPQIFLPEQVPSTMEFGVQTDYQRLHDVILWDAQVQTSYLDETLGIKESGDISWNRRNVLLTCIFFLCSFAVFILYILREPIFICRRFPSFNVDLTYFSPPAI